MSSSSPKTATSHLAKSASTCRTEPPMADLIAELEGVVRLQKEFDEARGHRAGCDAMDAEEDASVNFLRTHHAEIAAAVRDSVPASELAKLLPGAYYMDPPDGGDVPLIEQL